jgi:hypothetical protein
MALQVGAPKGTGIFESSSTTTVERFADRWVTPGGIPVSFHAEPFRVGRRTTDPRDLGLHEEHARKRRVVELELRRKLAELTDRYALRAELRPVALARVRLPALVVPIVIQRRQALRDYRLYWNSLTKKFEPLSCSRCRRGTFSATFANETVDLLCQACAEGK